MTETSKTTLAQYSSLPWKSGDGYSFGGGAILTIGDRSFDLGEGDVAHVIAREIVRRWNACASEEGRQ
jgi:hypothetical protein